MQISPDIAERIHNDLQQAQNHAASGNLPRAKEICLAALEQCPGYPDTHQILGLIFQQERNFEAAIKHLAKSLEAAPEQPHVLTRLGYLHAEQGQGGKAADALERAIALDAGNGLAWRLLAGVKPYEELADFTQRVERTLLEEPKADPQRRIQLLFALAKAYARLGERGKSLDFAGIGKFIQEKISGQWEEAFRAFVSSTREVFSNDLPQAGGSGQGSIRPVFVVGLPRSGASLVSEILRTGRKVFDAGPSPAMEKVVAALARQQPNTSYPENAASLSQADLEALAGVYWQHYSGLPKGTSLVVDRQPANLHFLGLIRMLFPAARVIHVRRNGLDACHDIFSEYFPEAVHPHFTSARSIGVYTALCDELATVWRGLMADRVLEVDYHKLITKPETEANRILEFCGVKGASKMPRLSAASANLSPEGLGEQFKHRLWQYEEGRSGKPPPPEAALKEIRESLIRARKCVVENNLSRATKHADRILAGDPHQADALQIKASVAAKENELDPAAEWYRKCLEVAPVQPSVWLKLAKIYIAARDLEKARYSLTIALIENPENPEALTLMGSLLLAERDSASARMFLERAIAADPSYGNAYDYLIQIEGYELKPELVTRLKENAESEREDLKTAAIANFVLARYHLKNKHKEQFLHHVKRANALQAGITLERSSYGPLVAESKKLFTKEFLQDSPALKANTPVPIFIVGLPRSGTTLIEQILGCHEKVFPADEIQVVMSHLVKAVESGDGESYPQSLLKRSQPELKKVAETYLRRMREISDKPYITDKMPTNLFFLGIIRKCLPFAKVIYAKRNLMDTALSLYTHRLADSLDYGFDFKAMAGFARLSVDMMEFWKNLMPGFVLDVQYEEVVAEPEEQIRRMLEFCGLEWEPRCLEFHKSNRPALTLSTTQVQKPIYKTSVGKWKQYAELMEPFRKGVEDLIDADGFLKG